MLAWLTELRETLSYVYQFIIKDIIKDIDEHSMKKWQGLEGSQVQWLLSTWSCGDTLPALYCVRQLSSSLNLLDFYKVFIFRHD